MTALRLIVAGAVVLACAFFLLSAGSVLAADEARPLDMRAEVCPDTVHIKGRLAAALFVSSQYLMREKARKAGGADPVFDLCMAQVASYDVNAGVGGDGSTATVVFIPNDRCSKPGGFIKGGVMSVEVGVDGGVLGASVQK